MVVGVFDFDFDCMYDGGVKCIRFHKIFLIIWK